MPKAGRKKYYAVRRGWEGPKIYDDWEETKKNVSRFRGAEYKGFLTKSQAEEWLGLPIGGSEEILESSLPRLDVPLVQEVITDPTMDVDQDVAAGVPSGSKTPSSVSLDPPPDVQAPSEPEHLPTPEIKLSDEQQHVLNKVKARQNIFFTGSAGTGKSVLLREIIRWCKDQGLHFATTALTGIAAVNIGGCTVHSWAGIGLGKEPAEKLVGKILGQDKYKRMKEKQRRREQGVASESDDSDSDSSQPRVIKRWRQCNVLIVDEISMMDGNLFDKLEFIARALRENSKPFGGIQLVLSGDFCQLPPVPDSNWGVPIPATFAFDAKTWNKCIGRPVVLKKVFRQKDQKFVNMLNAMRFGNLDDEIVTEFRKLSRAVTYEDGLEPTELFPTRNEVDTANSTRLRNINAELYIFNAVDRPGYDANGNRVSLEAMKRAVDRLVAPQSITVKAGAQVMLIKNIVQGLLVNGSLGRITDFCTPREASQQGIMIGLPESQKPSKQKGKKLIEQYRDGHSDIPPHLAEHKWPVVTFSTVEGPRKMLCVPNIWEVNNAEGTIEATREQVPLILAWALSIHKSQGQTLERVKVNLSKTFEKGQAYVALSRATNMQSLQVIGFDPMKVMAHPRVLEWTRLNTDTRLPSSAPPRDQIDEDLEFWEDEME